MCTVSHICGSFWSNLGWRWHTYFCESLVYYIASAMEWNDKKVFRWMYLICSFFEGEITYGMTKYAKYAFFVLYSFNGAINGIQKGLYWDTHSMAIYPCFISSPISLIWNHQLLSQKMVTILLYLLSEFLPSNSQHLQIAVSLKGLHWCCSCLLYMKSHSCRFFCFVIWFVYFSSSERMCDLLTIFLWNERGNIYPS